MAYSNRKRLGDIAERLVADWLTSKEPDGWHWHDTNAERVMPIPAIIALGDAIDEHPLLCWFRYQPDFYAITPDGQPCYIEAKASEHIERQAYEQYLRIEREQQIPVFLVLMLNEGRPQLLLLRVSQIKFHQQDWQPGDKARGSGNEYRTIDLEHSKWSIIKVTTKGDNNEVS